MSMYLGDYVDDATVDFCFTTVNTSGAPTQLAGTPAISVYKDNNTTQTTTGVTLTVDFDSVTGLNHVRIATTDAFYATGTDFHVVITTGTVGGTSVVGYCVAQFSIEKRRADANVTKFGGTAGTFSSGRPEVNTTHVAGTSQTAGDIIGDTNDIQARLPAALVGGRIDASVGAMAANVITAAATAADFTTEVTSGLSTLDAAGVRTAVGLASANLDTQLTAIDDFLDTEIAAIKTKTDSLTFTVAGVVDANIQRINDVTIVGDGSATPFNV